jgi:formate hydrogenlyase subunit 4
MVTFASNPVSWLVFFILIAGAPLFSGIVNKFKARLSGRFGASVLQPYFDLARLARKETVYSRSSGFLLTDGALAEWGASVKMNLLRSCLSFPGNPPRATP